MSLLYKTPGRLITGSFYLCKLGSEIDMRFSSHILLLSFYLLFTLTSCKKKSDDGLITYKFNEEDKKWLIYQPNQIVNFKRSNERLQFIAEQIPESSFPGGPSCLFCSFTYAQISNGTRLRALNDTALFIVSFTKTIPPGADIYNPPPASQGYLFAEINFFWKNPGSTFWYLNNPNFQGINQPSFTFETITINGQLYNKVLKYEQPTFYGMGMIKYFYYDKVGGLLKFATHSGDEWIRE